MSLAAFWWRHARWPLGLLLATLIAAGYTELDRQFAAAVFYRADSGWIGAHSWIANDLIHGGGRWLVRLGGAAVLSILLLSYRFPRLRDYRRPAMFVFSAVGLAVIVVATLKTTTNIDCPWDLTGFGGLRPHLGLLEPRPDDLPHAQCFPAAHAGSGYAWMGLYFAARERSRKWALRCLFGGLLLGLIFGFAQQSRGAHFVSHDLVSASLTWLTTLTVYVGIFRGRLWTHPSAALQR